ncbi:Os01g0390750 [Oryza sativa Japonica Group]|uniref:Os01g0390750 protein n=1 Tax=Oryza sativa subsp. japonica TaxID=39947 RepID=C7IXB9_ORYSJ|nr:Os01g0390750 [Oryza sativa Japonica Group]|eukprot:NP_001172361.1 Os01g0390750 [Oryza sativa Japonica Group]
MNILLAISLRPAGGDAAAAEQPLLRARRLVAAAGDVLLLACCAIGLLCICATARKPSPTFRYTHTQSYQIKCCIPRANLGGNTFWRLRDSAGESIERKKQELERLTLLCFQKTRQGIVQKEATLPSVYVEPKVKPTVSDPPVTQEQIALMIDQSVSAVVFNTHEVFIKNMDHALDARFNACVKSVISASNGKDTQRQVSHNTNASTSSTTGKSKQGLDASAMFTTQQNTPMTQIYSRTNGGGSAGSAGALPFPMQHDVGQGGTPFTLPQPNSSASSAPIITNSNYDSRVNGNLESTFVPPYPTVAYNIPRIPPQGSVITYGALPNSNNSFLQHAPYTPPTQMTQFLHGTPQPNIF